MKLNKVTRFTDLQWDWLEAVVLVKDVLKCIITAPGEQFVTMDSLTQQQELLAILLVSGTYMYITYTDLLVMYFIYLFIWTSHSHTIKSVKHWVQQQSRRYR